MSGKTIVLTGGSSGIGSATSQLLLEEGANVISLDVKKPQAEVTRYIECDLSDLKSIDEAIHSLPDKFDSLLNIAGVPGTLDPITVMKVNFLGLVRLSEGLKEKISTNGSIVNVASIAGFNWARNIKRIIDLLHMKDESEKLNWCEEENMNGDDAYSFSKECVIVYTMLLAGNLAHKNIRCNSVSPGPVATPLLPDFRKQTTAGQIDWLIQKIGRAADPKEIGNVIHYLATGPSSYINGRDIIVDGGLSAGLTMGWIDKKESPLYQATKSNSS